MTSHPIIWGQTWWRAFDCSTWTFWNRLTCSDPAAYLGFIDSCIPGRCWVLETISYRHVSNFPACNTRIDSLVRSSYRHPFWLDQAGALFLIFRSPVWHSGLFGFVEFSVCPAVVRRDSVAPSGWGLLSTARLCCRCTLSKIWSYFCFQAVIFGLSCLPRICFDPFLFMAMASKHRSRWPLGCQGYYRIWFHSSFHKLSFPIQQTPAFLFRLPLIS